MMTLTNQQLEAIVARALPAERLDEANPLPGDRYLLTLAGGERLNVQLYAATDAATAAAMALRLLRAEVDLPIPQLRASDPEGATVGVPYILTSEVTGEPLGQVLSRIADDQFYKLGRQLGETICRVHRLACERYGSLGEGSSSTASTRLAQETDGERDYVLARLEQDLRRCGELGMLDRKAGGEITAWFEHSFQPSGRQPALTHGGLSPQTILARPSKADWRISGLLGWEHALGWSPAWDHVTFLDATDEPRYFGLRVGYGNGYDENTNRAYEQLREHAMAPYRVLLNLRRMQEAYTAGRIAECQQRREVLRGLMRFLDA